MHTLTPDPCPIKKCVCFDTTFAHLKEAEIKSLEEAAQRFGCGTNCGLCKPYIQKMIVTGETEFSIETT